MANNFMKDILGFGIPDVYGGILTQDQLNQLSDQATKRGISMGLLDFITTPKNQGFGTITPYIGKAVGSGLQSYQGGLDAGLAGAIKAKALQTDDTPKFGTIDPSKYTPESVAKFEMTKKASDLRRITDPTTTKGMTDAEIAQLETAFPGFKTDEQTKALLRTDRTKGLDLFKTKYTEDKKSDTEAFPQKVDQVAKTFSDKINPETQQPYSETYGKNVRFADLSREDSDAVLKQINEQELANKIKVAKAQFDTPQAKFDRTQILRKDYDKAIKDINFEEMEQAFKQVETATQNNTPISNVASAIKIMKLLDPGSVVRESELGIALNKTRGLVDGWKTFVERTYTGNQLTETQQKEFYQLAQQFYKIVQESKSKIDNKYLQFSQDAQVNPEQVIGRQGVVGSVPEYDMETGEWK
jgi:hypothetical protein